MINGFKGKWFGDPLVNALVFMVFVCMVSIYAFEYRWHNIVQDHIQWDELSNQARLDLSTAHIRVEENVAGDPNERPEDIVRLVGEAEERIKILLTYQPMAGDAQLKKNAHSLLTQIDRFRALARERLSAPTGAPFDPEKDEVFDDLFEQIIATHGLISRSVNHNLVRISARQETLFVLLVGGVIGGVGGVVFFTWRRGMRKRFLEHAFRDLAVGFGARFGDGFFQEMVAYLSNTLGMDYAIIGELDRSGRCIKVAASRVKGETGALEEYELKDTPCENVVEKGICSYDRNVAALFPRDRMLRELGIVSYAGAPLRNPAGETIGVVVLLHTAPLKHRVLSETLIAVCAERISAEIERKKVEGSLQRVVELAPDVICTGNMDTGRMETVNRSAATMFGFDLKELTDRPLAEFLHPDDRARTVRELRDRGSRSEPYYLENRFRCKDGRCRWVGWTVQPFPHEGIFYAVGRDITQRKEEAEKKEQALKELAERMKELNCLYNITRLTARHDMTLPEILQGVVNTVPSGFQYEGHVCARLTYLDRDFTSCADKNGVPFRETDVCLALDVVVSGHPVGRVAAYYDGALPADGTGPFLQEEADMLALVVTQLSVLIERKTAEEDLSRAKEKAEKATELKNKFVSLVAHDIKSPFTGILGMLQLLERDEKNPLSGQQKTVVSRAIQSGHHLLAMTDELLQITRLESGELTPKPTFIDACTVVVNAVGSISFLAKSKGVNVVNAVQPSTRVYADRALLEEVMQNLLTNAVKFSRAGDTVTVFARTGKTVRLEVEDTGIGIGQELKKMLFSHEEKTSRRGTDNERGTGLGLPLSQDIMKAHGGCIKVTSEEGKGSRFSACLPNVRPRVLLVDDEDMFRFHQEVGLQPLDVEVYQACNGVEALKAVREVRPDIIVTDLTMPGVDGLELLKAVKGDPDTMKIPIIVVSADHSREVRDLVFALGADDFIRKPISMDVFLPRVKRFLFDAAFVPVV